MAQNAYYGPIAEVLSRLNPMMRSSSTSSSATTRDWWETVNPESGLSEWHDFSYDTLINGWGHLLSDSTPVKGGLEEDVTDTQRSIDDEQKVDNIAQEWTIKSVREALKHGFGMMRPNSQHQITIVQHPARKLQKWSGGKNRTGKPDMAIYYKGADASWLVMGENKTSQAWDYSKVILGRRSPSHTSVRPFNQLTTYCMMGDTRYGWIMSEKELVVCRISFVPDGDEKVWKVEHKCISWDAAGLGTLTINLSIWWLGMMAISESYRAVKPKSQTIPIRLWWEDRLDGQTVGYTHHLSGRRLLVDEMPMPAGTYPSHPRELPAGVDLQSYQSSCTG